MKTRFSKLNATFYPLNFDYERLPTDIIEVPMEDYTLAMARNSGDTLDVVNNRVVVVAKLPQNLAELKLAKKAQITLAFNLTMSQIVGDTPAHEVSSWGKQEMEARAFSNAATALNPTPLIDNLATSRGIPKALLARKIVAKADQFASYSGQLIGKRQGLEDAVDAATSKTALAAITW